MLIRLCNTLTLSILFILLNSASAYNRNIRTRTLKCYSANSLLLASELASVDQIFVHAAQKALDGGLAGASASAVQVISLMWLRTTINYQYRYGGSTGEALMKLIKEGGIGRLYQGTKTL